MFRLARGIPVPLPRARVIGSRVKRERKEMIIAESSIDQRCMIFPSRAKCAERNFVPDSIRRKSESLFAFAKFDLSRRALFLLRKLSHRFDYCSFAFLVAAHLVRVATGNRPMTSEGEGDR